MSFLDFLIAKALKYSEVYIHVTENHRFDTKPPPQKLWPIVGLGHRIFGVSLRSVEELGSDDIGVVVVVLVWSPDCLGITVCCGSKMTSIEEDLNGTVS